MSNENEKIQAELAEYNADVEKAIAKFPERPHLPEQRLYTPLDIEGTDYADEISFPGVYPYTRGVQPTMYRGRFWTMRMYAGFSTAEESNKRYRYLIESGATGLSCAFDLPTQIGYDSTDDISEGEVGKVGVAIDSLADMEILFDQIDLGKVSTSMTINAPASVLLAMYIAVAEKQGVPADQLKGTIQNDILKEYAARGTYIFPPRPSMRLITNIFEYCSKYVPKWNTISISGYHIREAGSTASQEIAFTIADGDSPMANLRRKNGRDKAWKVKYLGVGNESWGCGSIEIPFSFHEGIEGRVYGKQQSLYFFIGLHRFPALAVQPALTRVP